MGSTESTKQIVLRSSSILKEYCQKYIPAKTTFSVLINRNTSRIKRIDQRVKSKTNLKKAKPFAILKQKLKFQNNHLMI